jgi:hypothetical protein
MAAAAAAPKSPVYSDPTICFFPDESTLRRRLEKHSTIQELAKTIPKLAKTLSRYFADEDFPDCLVVDAVENFKLLQPADEELGRQWEIAKALADCKSDYSSEGIWERASSAVSKIVFPKREPGSKPSKYIFPDEAPLLSLLEKDAMGYDSVLRQPSWYKEKGITDYLAYALGGETASETLIRLTVIEALRDNASDLNEKQRTIKMAFVLEYLLKCAKPAPKPAESATAAAGTDNKSAPTTAAAKK